MALPRKGAKRLSRKAKDSTNWLLSPLPTRCALFLVLKGELELARNDIDLCQSDLRQVLFLLESCTGEQPCPCPWAMVRGTHTLFNKSFYVRVWFPSKSETSGPRAKLPLLQSDHWCSSFG